MRVMWLWSAKPLAAAASARLAPWRIRWLLQQPRVRWQPVGIGEAAQQLVAAQARPCGHLRQGGRIEWRIGQPFTHLAQRTRGDGAAGASVLRRHRGAGVAREQQAGDLGQRLLARQLACRIGCSVGTGCVGAPVGDAVEQGGERLRQGRILEHRAHQGYVATVNDQPALSLQRLGLDVHHAPAAGGAAQRLAVVDLARIGGDHIARIGLDRPAPAGRALRPLHQQPQPVHRVPMFAEVAGTFDVRAVHTLPGRSKDLRAVVGSGCHGTDYCNQNLKEPR
jgi:hypothetical protein